MGMYVAMELVPHSLHIVRWNSNEKNMMLLYLKEGCLCMEDRLGFSRNEGRAAFLLFLYSRVCTFLDKVRNHMILVVGNVVLSF